jgi:transcription initiation factor TFIIF subunit alpha
MEKPENKPQASQTKMSKPNGANGHTIPAKFSKAPLFHTHRKRDKDRLLNVSTPTPTPSPPHANSPSSTPSRATPRQRPAAAVKIEDEDAKPSAFSGPYQEFRLMSSNLNGWKYDVMKLESRKPVDVELWQHPIKLNRKDPKRDWETVDVVAVPQAVGPMLGSDGKPVIGADGKVVMVDADGRPIHGNNGEGGSGSKFNKDKAVGGRKKFQKKTKQVFLVPEATRMLRKEERYPWVLEDGTGSQVWTGMLEDLNKAETHAMFLPTAENVFKFVPPHRWYKFQKRPSYKIPSLEEAEKLVSTGLLCAEYVLHLCA